MMTIQLKNTMLVMMMRQARELNMYSTAADSTQTDFSSKEIED